MEKKKHSFYTRFNLPTSEVVDVGDYSFVNQESLEESDIYTILHRYSRGQLVPSSKFKAVYADVSKAGDFADCYDFVNKSIDDFEALPLEIRLKFRNDPFFFYESCAKDPELLTKYVQELNPDVKPSENSSSVQAADNAPQAESVSS